MSSSRDLDQLRRLLLGSLYFECRSNPTSVTEDRLKNQFKKVQCSGCMTDVPFEQFVDVCQLKSAFLPLNISKNTNRDCLESFYGQNIQDAVVESVVLEEYKSNKSSTSYRPTSPTIEEEQDCVVCNQYLKGSSEPIATLCGHHAHSTCIKEHMEAQGNLKCPKCSGYLIPSIQGQQDTSKPSKVSPTVYLGGKPFEQQPESPRASPKIYLGGRPFEQFNQPSLTTLKSPTSNLKVKLSLLD